MIGQYLSNTNESATVSISQNFLELNKALLAHFRHEMHLVGQLATSKLLLGVYYFDFTKKPCIIIREQQKKIQFTMQEREREEKMDRNSD